MPAEPKNLDPRDTNPARSFHVADESQVLVTIEITYQGGGWWRAFADVGGPKIFTYASRSLSDTQKWAASTMEEHADKARATCAEICGTDGQDTTGNGSFACGVMNPHGISVGISDADGNDRLQDYLINGM